MKSNKIKICGITDLSIANFCIDSQADYLGFVSYEHSPRNISLNDSKDIISKLSKPIDTVAVTVNANINDIKKIEDSGFNYIQLHGSENLSYLDAIKKNTQLKIIKAFGISTQADFDTINDYKDLCDYFLLDAKPEITEMPGGNAKKFDWGLLVSQNLKKEFFLSGGLNIDNLEIALKKNITSFFDVSSSVESSPGVKDKVKISDFINKVKTK